MTVLPNFTPKPITDKTRDECRKRFGYANDDWVIMCAAAWNCYHKRIDYLIEEVAKIKDPKVKIVALWAARARSRIKLKNLAEQLLPNRVQWHTLPVEEISQALQTADVFVLPSLNELFGGVLIEAIMFGIPVIAHHTAASQQLSDFKLRTYD